MLQYDIEGNAILIGISILMDLGDQSECWNRRSVYIPLAPFIRDKDSFLFSNLQDIKSSTIEPVQFKLFRTTNSGNFRGVAHVECHAGKRWKRVSIILGVMTFILFGTTVLLGFSVMFLLLKIRRVQEKKRRLDVISRPSSPRFNTVLLDDVVVETVNEGEEADVRMMEPAGLLFC